MGKQANGTERSETMKDGFGAPLLDLEFQKKCIKPVFELYYSFLVKRCDYKRV